MSGTERASTASLVKAFSCASSGSSPSTQQMPDLLERATARQLGGVVAAVVEEPFLAANVADRRSRPRRRPRVRGARGPGGADPAGCTSSMCATRTTWRIERMPATWSPSITGRWRKRRSRKTSRPFSTVSVTETVTGFLVMTSSTLAVPGSMPCPTERSRSRSLSMPRSRPCGSSTAAAPTLAPSRITEASARVMVVGTTTAGLCITSATVRDAVTVSV